MNKEVSKTGCEEVIGYVVKEREDRRRRYGQEPELQKQKVREMNQVLDYLRWCEKKLVEVGYPL